MTSKSIVFAVLGFPALFGASALGQEPSLGQGLFSPLVGQLATAVVTAALAPVGG